MTVTPAVESKMCEGCCLLQRYHSLLPTKHSSLIPSLYLVPRLLLSWCICMAVSCMFYGGYAAKTADNWMWADTKSFFFCQVLFGCQTVAFNVQVKDKNPLILIGTKTNYTSVTLQRFKLNVWPTFTAESSFPFLKTVLLSKCLFLFWNRMTHPPRVTEHRVTYPFLRAQKLMTHPLSAPAHPSRYFLTSPLLSPFNGPKETALASVSFGNEIIINRNNMKRA